MSFQEKSLTPSQVDPRKNEEKSDGILKTLLQLIHQIQQAEILDLALGKRQKVVLLIDEASLLRLEVFAELHTLTQFVMAIGKNSYVPAPGWEPKTFLSLQG